MYVGIFAQMFKCLQALQKQAMPAYLHTHVFTKIYICIQLYLYERRSGDKYVDSRCCASASTLIRLVVGVLGWRGVRDTEESNLILKNECISVGMHWALLCFCLFPPVPFFSLSYIHRFLFSSPTHPPMVTGDSIMITAIFFTHFTTTASQDQHKHQHQHQLLNTTLNFKLNT